MIPSCFRCCGRSSDVLSQISDQNDNETGPKFPTKDRANTSSVSADSKIFSIFREGGMYRSDILKEMEQNLKAARFQGQEREVKDREHLKYKVDIYQMRSTIGDRPFSMNTFSSTPLSLFFHRFDAQQKNQDKKSFCIQIEQGVIAGVLGGLCGDAVVNVASKFFQDDFSGELTEKSDCPFQAFESTIDKIQTIVKADASLAGKGSTGVFCFIDPTNQRVYTATIGDKEEARLYPNFSNISIPLSVFKNQESSDERIRIRKSGYEQPPNLKGTTRSLGLANFPTVWHKPEITEQNIEEGDVLVLASPGLRADFSERSIINQVKQVPLRDLPQKLTGSSNSSIVVVRVDG